jgi:hypothetical protein
MNRDELKKRTQLQKEMAKACDDLRAARSVYEMDKKMFRQASEVLKEATRKRDVARSRIEGANFVLGTEQAIFYKVRK